MQAFEFTPLYDSDNPQPTTIKDGPYNVSPFEQPPTFVILGYNKNDALRALSLVTPKINEDAVSTFESAFSTSSKAELMLELIMKANKYLGSIQIVSVAAVYSEDEIALIRIEAAEGSRTRIIYQEKDSTLAQNLLVKPRRPYFDEVRQTVLSHF